MTMRKLAAGMVCAVALLLACAAPAVAAVEERLPPEVSQDVEIEKLHEDFEAHDKIINYMLYPITVLVGILALGGAIGIVFSIRDQRRVSQLHELSVAGEMSSQRRTEQSYATFFEQSQTTLSLVNETLQLAKDATEQAAKSMDDKAKLRVDEIEEKAQKLMLGLSHEFDAVVFDVDRRHELQEIAKELGTLEGYLSLQKIKLGHYTQFVKAIDRFVRNEAEAALAELQLASQDPIVGDLQKFIEYWIGYIFTTVGQYREAIDQFEHDELNVSETSSQHVQLERIIIETEFFLIAKERPKAEGNEKSEAERDEKPGAEQDEVVDSRPPKVRFEAVVSLLDRLASLSQRLEGSRTKSEEAHTRMEVARTRADIYEWVAYDPGHLDDPIDQATVDQAKQIIEAWEKEASESSRLAEGGASSGEPEFEEAGSAEGESGAATEFIESSLWPALETEDLFRCWALLQAQKLCSNWEKASADVAFALAECHFKLRDVNAAKEFRTAEKELHEEMVEPRELRHEASHLQCLLICHCRLLKVQILEEEDAEEKKGKMAADQQEEGESTHSQQEDGESIDSQQEDRAIRANQREILEKLKKMGRGRVTIFSQIQRRNLTQDEFRVEVNKIAAGMGIRDQQDGSGNEGGTDAAESS